MELAIPGLFPADVVSTGIEGGQRVGRRIVSGGAGHVDGRAEQVSG